MLREQCHSPQEQANPKEQDTDICRSVMAQHCLDTSTLCQLTQQDRLLVLILRDSAVPDPTQFFPRQFLYLQN